MTSGSARLVDWDHTPENLTVSTKKRKWIFHLMLVSTLMTFLRFSFKVFPPYGTFIVLTALFTRSDIQIQNLRAEMSLVLRKLSEQNSRDFVLELQKRLAYGLIRFGLLKNFVIGNSIYYQIHSSLFIFYRLRELLVYSTSLGFWCLVPQTGDSIRGPSWIRSHWIPTLPIRFCCRWKFRLLMWTTILLLLFSEILWHYT